MPRDRDYSARNVIAAVLNETWAIEHRKLDQIVAFLEMRAAGAVLSEDEIRASMSLRSEASFDDFAEPLTERDDGRMIVDGVEVLGLYDTLGPRMNLMMRFSGGTSTQKFGQAFDRAMADPNVRAIMIEVDSPGGAVTGTEELRQKIFAARGKKRVVAVARGMMASAAYYLGSAAAEVIATPSTEVGSIGVYLVTNDVTGAAEKMGVRYTVFRAGELKASGSPYEALTDNRKAAIQSRVDGPYRMFLQAVAEHRGISPETVAKDFGQGTVFLADEALRRGMIDRVDSIDAVFAEMRQRARGTQQQPTAAEQINVTTGAAAEIPPPISLPKLEKSKMNPRIKAALYALNLIDDLQAADNVCQAALSGFFRGQVPQGDDAILKGLTQGHVASAATPAPAESNQVPANVQRASNNELAEARVAERQRIEGIQSRAALLNRTGCTVTQEQIAAAVNDGATPAEAADRWLQATASPQQNQERPIGRISAVGSEVDQWHAAAADGLVIRSRRQRGQSVEGFDARPGAEQASRMSALQIAQRDLQLAGVRVAEGADAEDVATQWLRMHGEFRILADGGVTSANYPNLLGAFSNRSLDESAMRRETTYRLWTAQHPSVSDFNPRLIMGQSSVGDLPEIAGDGDGTPETSSAEEALAWFQVVRRATKLKLTPYMVTQDQLGAFADSFGKLAWAQDRTIDKLCIDLLLANPTLLDGVAFFDNATHKNLIGSGGAAPSTTTAKANRLLMRTQTEPGGTDALELEPMVTLVPDELYDAARQTFLDTARISELLYKTTDSALNLYRDANHRVIASQRLSASSAVVWYQFTDPSLMPVIKVVYQTGYENGRRESWWDADTQCRYFRHETRVAAFIAGFRGVVKNPGQ